MKAVHVMFAALAAALVFGLVPISTNEMGSFGRSVDCGSAWIPNDDGLTGTGEAACAEGGLNTNRTASFALLAVTAVFAIVAVVEANRQLDVEAKTPLVVPPAAPPSPAGPAAVPTPPAGPGAAPSPPTV